MAGLLGLLGLTTLFGMSMTNSVKLDMEYKGAKMAAQNKGKDIFYCNGTAYWTETCEPVQIDMVFGCCNVRGLKTGRLYKSERSENAILVDEINDKYRKAINYCKAAEYKFLPWYFPHTLTCCHRENTTLCTGVEIETGKKYICFTIRKEDTYCPGDWGLVYLEDKPHRSYTEYGTKWYYDAVHDEEPYDYYNNMDKYICEKHNGYENDKTCFYYSKIYHVSEKEYKERTTPIEGYPYKFYQHYGY